MDVWGSPARSVARLAAVGTLLLLAPTFHLGSSGAASAAEKGGASVGAASTASASSAASAGPVNGASAGPVNGASAGVGVDGASAPIARASAGLRVVHFPVDHQLYPRTRIGDRTAKLSVSVSSSSTEVTSLTLTTSAKGTRTGTSTGTVTRGHTVTLTTRVPVALAGSSVVLTAHSAGGSSVVARARDVVAGDVYVVNGQSNAEAAAFPMEDPAAQADAADPWVRTVGGGWDTTARSAADRGWYVATAGGGRNSSGSIGKWELRMADLLVRRHHVPVAVLNGAHSGEPISWFEPKHVQPGDAGNNYDRLLARLDAYGLAGSVRTVIFYQGESDAHSVAEARHWKPAFDALLDAWHASFPRLAHVYVTQVRGCPGSPSAAIQRIRQAQQGLDALPGVRVVSTDALRNQDGCHFHYTGGYRVLGTRYAALIGQDTYGAP
jgi:hypothetical protein